MRQGTMILLAKDTKNVKLEMLNALCVRHKDYDAPMPSVVYEQYNPTMLKGKDTLVVVGLSKILTPANRTKIGPYLLRPIPGVKRISIDTTLFIVEPWRAWWHFGCVGAKYREFSYSYLAESRWKAAQEGHGGDPFSLEEIGKWGDGVIQSMDKNHFDDVSVHVIQMSKDIHEAYQALKAKCFDEEHTSAAIIKRLSDFADSACPFRVIPTMSQLFKRTSHRIVATDLGVDNWLTGQIMNMVTLTNGIASRFYDGCH
jgi:hypothetical protein